MIVPELHIDRIVGMTVSNAKIFVCLVVNDDTSFGLIIDIPSEVASVVLSTTLTSSSDVANTVMAYTSTT